MSKLFEPTEINRLNIKNRFVRSATYEAMSGLDGKVQDQLLSYMADLAKGDVGLIISGHTHVVLEGQAGPRQMGIYSDDMLDGLKKMTATIHENGSLVAAQLAHAGKKGIGCGEYGPLGPSDDFEEKVLIASAMTAKDIDRTAKAFAKAAIRAVKSGFDAVQIHAAHGYLLSQFLSPHYNKRGDEYGGKLENRARFLLQVCDKVRESVGPSFPVMVKINSEDFVKNGMTEEETIEVCRMLEEHTVDAIEISGGTFESGKFTPSRAGTSKSEDREFYYEETAKLLKEKINIPLILVGGFLSFNVVEKAVTSGLADYIALSRPLIREPHLIKRWAEGNREKATCISCNKCFSTLSMEEALHCAAEKKA
ncbi:oxidoreductase [Maridesulfovibrio frigidus]|uniref:oxidoreductase n=1 Tax=Maridesulfovibrio frigidus TaxID=340956 RepID=UPI0004E18200|nr:NADH:flavin oxidoreductase [Maridesulfovibrio frigidus]